MGKAGAGRDRPLDAVEAPLCATTSLHPHQALSPSPGSAQRKWSRGAHRAGRERTQLVPRGAGQAASSAPEAGEPASNGRRGRGSVPHLAPYLLAKEDDFLYGSS